MQRVSLKSRTVGVLAASLLAMASLACGPPQVRLPTPSANCDATKIDDCRARCDNNEPRACYRLGWFYEDGENVPKSFNQALKLYERACDAKWAVACRALGEIYWRGHKRPRDRKRAIEYFSQACALGMDEACPTDNERALAEGKRKAADQPVEAGVSVSVSSDAAPAAPAAPTP